MVWDNQWCVASICFISVELHCYMAAPCKPHTLRVEAAIRYSSALVRSNWNDPWRQWSCWQLAKKIHVSSFPRGLFPSHTQSSDHRHGDRMQEPNPQRRWSKWRRRSLSNKKHLGYEELSSLWWWNHHCCFCNCCIHIYSSTMLPL